MSKSPLLSDETSDLEEDIYPPHSGRETSSNVWRRRTLYFLQWTEHLLLGGCICLIYVLFTTGCGQTVTDAQCGKQLSAFSPTDLLDLAVNGYHTQQFEGSLLQSNKYKDPPSLDPPSKAVDEAWEIFKTIGAIRITEDDVRALGKDPRDSVRWPEKYGGGYIGFVESLHMLHCLDFVRKMTYHDHYVNDTYFQEDPFGVRRHADHCIDIIRQSLMCTADTGIFSYVWVEGYPRPFPDFSVYHKCRNFDAVLDWAKENQVTDVELADLDRNGTRVLDEYPLR